MENLNERIDKSLGSQIDFELDRELEHYLDRNLKIKLHNQSEILNQLFSLLEGQLKQLNGR